MDSANDATLSKIQEAMAAIYGARDWIFTMPVLVACTPHVNALHAYGANRIACFATARGAGEVPSQHIAPVQVIVEAHGRGRMGGIRASMDALASDHPAITGAIERFDPSQQARSMGPIFDDGRPTAGRAKWGARPASWQALEDKVVIDQLWRDAGITSAPYRVVRAELSEMRAAAQQVDAGLGTVQAGDAREGFHGGATLARWVRDEAQQQAVAKSYSEVCDELRIMPFIEGIPCSIHGVVMPDKTVSLIPCEMLVLKSSATGRFFYLGASTLWRPSSSATSTMRSACEAVGEELRRKVGYRGAFTIDGVWGRSGFVPTELNPRVGAALETLCRGIDGFSMQLFNHAVIEGIDTGCDGLQLEALLRAHAQTHRRWRLGIMCDRAIKPFSGQIRRDDQGVRWSDPGAAGAIAIEAAESHGGATYVRLQGTADDFEPGVTLSGFARDVIQWLNDHHAADLGTWEAVDPSP